MQSPRGTVLVSTIEPKSEGWLAQITAYFKKVWPVDKVVIVGLHGWIPSWRLRTVIGRPQVTSLLLTESLESAIKITNPFVDVACYPLEAEGTVQERLNRHLEQIESNESLLADLRSDALIIFIAHSQGVPASTFLIEELLKREILFDIKRIQLLGLAGILEGPDIKLRQHPAVKYMEGRPAKELFHFGKRDSKLKTSFDLALGRFLHDGMRVKLIASWQDQVVPLSSALLCSFAPHPNLERSIYVSEKADEESNPVIKLVEISLNLLHDPGKWLLGAKILHSMSAELIASLYQGTAHSDIAVNATVYELLSRKIFEGSAKVGSKVMRSEDIFEVDEVILPWLMNDLKRLQNKQIEILVEMIREWNPAKSEWKILAKRLRSLMFQPLSKL